jgi:hypothetical protein
MTLPIVLFQQEHATLLIVHFRSSYQCSYFVLPCCHHDFNRRFSGKVKGESSYRSYLTYVSRVGEACGFQVEEDTLRIPSTKRVIFSFMCELVIFLCVCFFCVCCLFMCLCA